MRKVLLVTLATVVLGTSCSEFNKAVKASGEGAIGIKMAAAEKYYAIGAAGLAPGATRKQKRKAAGGFERALPLLEEALALHQRALVYQAEHQTDFLTAIKAVQAAAQ